MLSSMLIALLGTSGPIATSTLTPGYAFVTTQTGSAILGSWTEANGHTGLAAGDAICEFEAAQANLDVPTSYIAFLSDSQDDLYCRLHNLSGKVSNNCGQGSLPASAGPWLRKDGVPFATLASIVEHNAAIAPVAYTANGTLALSNQIYIGTDSDLVVGALGTCSDWTIDSNASPVATTNADNSIFFSSSSGCSGPRSLMCLRSGQNSPLNYGRRSGRLSFISAARGNGDLSTWNGVGVLTGIAAGDQVCQNEAAMSGLEAPASFKAWLSDSTHNAIDRYQNDGPWVRVDGVPVALSKTALTAPGFSQLTSLPTQIGTALGPGDFMLSGTAEGLAAGPNCANWTSAASTDTQVPGWGHFITLWSNWYTYAQGCDGSQFALYCYSDLDRVFDGSFESIPAY